MDDIGSRVMDVIALELATRPARLTRSTEFLEDLQLNASEIDDLKMALEDEFGIVLDDAAARRMVSIGDAIDYIERAVLARPPHWRAGIGAERRT